MRTDCKGIPYTDTLGFGSILADFGTSTSSTRVLVVLELVFWVFFCILCGFEGDKQVLRLRIL